MPLIRCRFISSSASASVCVGRHGDRVDDHPALEALHLAHGVGLFLDGQVAVEHADPAELRHTIAMSASVTVSIAEDRTGC